MELSLKKMTDSNKKNSFEEYFNSDLVKELQKKHQEDVQRSVGKYHMLPESDKIDMVQAICYIMCLAEKEGTSHRGLMNKLGIYPAGFWVDHLMDVHNALWTFYHEKNTTLDLQKNVEELQNFIEKEKKSKE